MATGTITNVIKDPAGNPVSTILIYATLKPGPGFRADGTEVAEITSTTSDNTGAYSLTLEQNSNITPTGTYYEIYENVPASYGGPNVWTIQVQSGSHTVLQSLATILPPGSAIMSGSNTPITLVTGESASAGTSPQFIRADASLGVPVGTPLSTAVQIGNSVSAGASGQFSDSAHVHAVTSGAPSSLTVGGGNVAGTSTAFPHLDHKHGLPAFGAPVDTGNANATGSSGLFAQSDHVHNTVGGGPSGSGAAITLSAGAAGASGVANTFVRGDATIGVPVAVPTTLQASVASNTVGSSTSLARADHKHATPTDFPTSLTPGGSNVAGTSLYFNSADHQHALPAFGTPVSTGGANSAGSSGLFAQSDHVHNTVGGAGGSNVAITIHPGDTAAAGTSGNFVRGDAVFGVPTTTPNSLTCGNNTNTAGTGTQFPRADHVHATPTGTPSSNALTNSAGASGNYSDAAHTHIGVGSATPSLSVGATAAAGSSALGLRSDVTIGVPTGSPSTLVVGGSNVAGTSTSFPHLDHIHALPAYGTPVGVGSSNQAGSSGLFAQSDHVHSGTTSSSTQVYTYAWTGTASSLVNGQTLTITAIAGQSAFTYPSAITAENVLISFNVTGLVNITSTGIWAVQPNWDGVGPDSDHSICMIPINSTTAYFSGQSFHMLKNSNSSSGTSPTFSVALLAGSGASTITTATHLNIQMACLVAS